MMLSFSNNKLIYCAVLLLVTFAVYMPSLGNDITNWDDNAHLTDNLTVRSLSLPNIKKMFTSTIFKTYIPLTVFSYAIEYHFFEYNAFVYHLDNVLLHLGVTVLVYFLAIKVGLSVKAAFLAGLIFGLHPMHVESVAWITERKDVLYSFFYMLALYQYWRYLENRNPKIYALTVLFGLLSILSKAMALSIPLIFLICDWLYKRKMDKWMILDKLPHFLYVIPIAWITFSLNKSVLAVNTNIFKAGLIYVWSFTFYIKKFFVPFNLFPIYEIPRPITLTSPPYFIACIIFIFILWMVIKFRKNRWVIFALLYYFFSIFFLLRHDDQAYASWVADRFMYLPSLGICFLLGKVACDWLDACRMKGKLIKRVTQVACACFILLLSIKTYAQSQLWENDIVLWNYVLEKNPDMPRALNNRGLAYKMNEQYDLALNDFNRAINYSPHYYKAYQNRGDVYGQVGKNELALNDFNKVLKFRSNIEEVYNNRGYIYSLQGKHKLALADFDKAIELNPSFSKAYYNRGNIYAAQNKYDLAIKDFNYLLKLDKENYRGFSNRGYVYMNQKKFDLAIKDFTQSIAINAEYANAYYNRSVCQQNLGRLNEALLDAVKAKALGANISDIYIEGLKKRVSTTQ